MPARFAPPGPGSGRQEGRFAGAFRTSARFGRHARPFRRHFRFGPFSTSLANCLGLGLDFRFCRTHVIGLNSAFFAYPFYGGFGYSLNSYAAEGYSGSDDAVRQLSAQIDQLQAEMASMREEQALRDYDRERRQGAPSASAQAESTGRAAPAAQNVSPTTLVFRDGTRQDVRNYAIVGNTLWIFSDQRARKLPVSSLDLEATRAVNEASGADFLR